MSPAKDTSWQKRMISVFQSTDANLVRQQKGILVRNSMQYVEVEILQTCSKLLYFHHEASHFPIKLP